jgi:type IV pilus assembly protein PilW
LTLIELLVAISISFVVILAVGYVFVGSRQTYRAQDGMARIQESARFAYEVLSKDIRMAGFNGCAASNTVNVLNDPSWYGGLDSLPLIGYEAGSGQPAAITGALAGRDSLTILHADNSPEYIIEQHTAAAAEFKLVGTSHDLIDGQIVVACNANGVDAAVFQITNSNQSNVTIVHNTGLSAPGNCTKALGAGTTCGGTQNFVTFDPGSRLMRLSGSTYFIRNNTAGEPSLYRQRLNVAAGAAATAAEELVEGVEDMQITYGVDVDATADNQADDYQTAAEIGNGSGTPAVPGADASARWNRVLSVRISLLMRTTENGITTQAQTYTYPPDAGAATTAADRRLRRVFTYVISVRNRL